MSIQEVRTAVSHLKSTGTLTTRTYRRFQVFTIVNYDYYQSIQAPTSTPYQQAANTLSTPYQQQYNNIKNNKNEKNIYVLSEKEKSDRLLDLFLNSVAERKLFFSLFYSKVFHRQEKLYLRQKEAGER